MPAEPGHAAKGEAAALGPEAQLQGQADVPALIWRRLVTRAGVLVSFQMFVWFWEIGDVCVTRVVGYLWARGPFNVFWRDGWMETCVPMLLGGGAEGTRMLTMWRWLSWGAPGASWVQIMSSSLLKTVIVSTSFGWVLTSLWEYIY